MIDNMDVTNNLEANLNEEANLIETYFNNDTDIKDNLNTETNLTNVSFDNGLDVEDMHPYIMANLMVKIDEIVQEIDTGSNISQQD